MRKRRRSTGGKTSTEGINHEKKVMNLVGERRKKIDRNVRVISTRIW